MHRAMIAMLIAGLALCGGQTLSQPSQPLKARYSADGLYNLANSYARAGKPGLAVLYYERAALLAPDDEAGQVDFRRWIGVVRDHLAGGTN